MTRRAVRARSTAHTRLRSTIETRRRRPDWLAKLRAARRRVTPFLQPRKQHPPLAPVVAGSNSSRSELAEAAAAAAAAWSPLPPPAPAPSASPEPAATPANDEPPPDDTQAWPELVTDAEARAAKVHVVELMAMLEVAADGLSPGGRESEKAGGAWHQMAVMERAAEGLSPFGARPHQYV